MSYSKYKAKKVQAFGQSFDSHREFNRYSELRLLEKAGKIQNLDRQVKFVLQDGFTLKGKRIQPITYIADFTYNRGDEYIVEDCKGYRTDIYKLKKKMFQYRYGIDILES